MKSNKLFLCLKIVTILIGLCGLLFCFWVIPYIGKSIISQNPELNHYYLPWLGLIWAAAIPCYIILVLAWKLFANIASNHAFTFANARMLKWVSLLVLGDVMFFFFMNLIYLFLNINHPSILLLSLLIVLIGFSFSVTSAALSYLTAKAAELQEFNDAVI